MKRFHQFLLIASFVPLCWLAMMAVHELGHVAAGWATGGTVTSVVLHPLAFSRTDVSPNPHPLWVAWAGPIAGVVLPLALYAIFCRAKVPGAYLLRFFAGFCLIANGAYIGAGSLDAAGDAGDMLRHGTPMWVLWMFGLLTLPTGLWLWHRLGPHFGLGVSDGRVDRWAAYLSLLILIIAVTAGFTLSARS